MIWLSSIAFFRPSPANAAAPLWVERHVIPSPSRSVRTSFACAVVQLKYGREELDDLIAHLGDGRHRSRKVLGELRANREQLEANGRATSGLKGGQAARGERRSCCDGQEVATTQRGGCLHRQKVTRRAADGEPQRRAITQTMAFRSSRLTLGSR